MVDGFLDAVGYKPTLAQAEQGSTIGGNRPICLGRATWDTGWFQAEIYRQLLLELEYQVARPCTFDNDIHVVANRDFLQANPAIRALLEAVVIPLDDISAQNALLLAGRQRPQTI